MLDWYHSVTDPCVQIEKPICNFRIVFLNAPCIYRIFFTYIDAIVSCVLPCEIFLVFCAL